MNTTQQRLRALENDIKALKATYAVAGGNVRMYISTTTMTITITGTTVVRVKFSPTYGAGHITMATMTGNAKVISGTGLYGFWAPHQEPQTGDGVVLAFPFDDPYAQHIPTTYQLTVTVAATSPGTFSMI